MLMGNRAGGGTWFQESERLAVVGGASTHTGALGQHTARFAGEQRKVHGRAERGGQQAPMREAKGGLTA